ncbi:hypothetical protein B0H13DRAFT_2563765, partial [Mycena leptocephala]
VPPSSISRSDTHTARRHPHLRHRHCAHTRTRPAHRVYMRACNFLHLAIPNGSLAISAPGYPGRTQAVAPAPRTGTCPCVHARTQEIRPRSPAHPHIRRRRTRTRTRRRRGGRTYPSESIGRALIGHLIDSALGMRESRKKRKSRYLEEEEER